MERSTDLDVVLAILLVLGVLFAMCILVWSIIELMEKSHFKQIFPSKLATYLYVLFVCFPAAVMPFFGYRLGDKHFPNTDIISTSVIVADSPPADHYRYIGGAYGGRKTFEHSSHLFRVSRKVTGLLAGVISALVYIVLSVLLVESCIVAPCDKQKQ